MIEDLLEHLGIEDIRPMGVEVQARCPMHERRTGAREHQPDNWSVNRVTGKHHCFSCGYQGSLVRLVVDISKMGLWEAHRIIREFGAEVNAEEREWEPRTVEVSDALAKYVKPPQRALDSRHLTPESADAFGLRWDLEDSAWVLPITGPGGEPWGYQLKSDEYVRNRPPGVKKSRTLFGLHVLVGPTVILVESPLDACYLHSLGFPAVASFGANVSDIQMRLLMDRCDKIVLALDNDSAGIGEMRRLIDQHWHHRKISMAVFDYRRKSRKDPGECSALEVRIGVERATMAAWWQ